MFQIGGPDMVAFRDPRVEWDPINERFWILMAELSYGADPEWEDGQRLHLAVSVDDSPANFLAHDPTSEPTGDWYVYTGADSFYLKDAAIPTALQFVGIPDHPVISIDGGYLWVAVNDLCPSQFEACSSPTVDRDSIIAFPLEHGTSSSILDGDPMSEAELKILHLDSLGPGLDDVTIRHYAVQEPFDQFADAQLFINVPESDGEVPGLYYDAVRLGAAWVDSFGELQYKWVDMVMEDELEEERYFAPAGPTWPRTPDSTWRPAARDSKFDSACLVRINNQWRILVGHQVVAADHAGSTPTPDGYSEFRWYLIDPDLANFAGTWKPTILEVGRAPAGGLTNGSTYQGAIGVNVNGQATITFTRSGDDDPDGWPSLVRARLTADFSAVQYEITSVFEQGPEQSLSGTTVVRQRLGTDYVDIQADTQHCGFWTVGTLVAFADAEPEPPVMSDTRAIWLTENGIVAQI